MERSNDCKAKQLSDITAKTAVNAGRSVRRFFHVQCASHISKGTVTKKLSHNSTAHTYTENSTQDVLFFI